MKGLAWYSAIVVGWSIVSLVIEILSGTAADVAINLWAIVLFVPVEIYLIKSLKQV